MIPIYGKFVSFDVNVNRFTPVRCCFEYTNFTCGNCPYLKSPFTFCDLHKVEKENCYFCNLVLSLSYTALLSKLKDLLPKNFKSTCCGCKVDVYCHVCGCPLEITDFEDNFVYCPECDNFTPFGEDD